ncbi:MAG: IS200/IS605 family transposase [Prevotellaceae bacterium]|jgi:putative transposase|nr:IS200/IS605 family transposase [Prevotellaceae bacterium]
MEMKSTKHSKYNINYHIVFCPKYRHSILQGEVEIYLKRLLKNICRHYEYDLPEIETMPDHVHLFISAKPTVAPTVIVKTLKSISAIWIFKKFPYMKQQKFWGAGLLSKGYYIGTAGTVTAENIRKYIENQKDVR